MYRKISGGKMDRRKFLAFTSIGLLATGTGAPARANDKLISPGEKLSDGPNDGLISWDQFLDRSISTAKNMIDDRSQGGQDAYLYALGSIASKLGELPDVQTSDFGGLNPAYELDLIFRDPDSPFIVLYWKMEPGAVLPAHCHPGANVCTLCTGGRAIIRNFDTVRGSPPCWSETDEQFGVIETKREVLRPGVVNTVTEMRNNIHRFEAGPEGAQGIDITSGYDRPPKPFSFLQIGERKSGSVKEGEFSGRWVGKEIERAL
jgi:hypothetical protein